MHNIPLILFLLMPAATSWAADWLSPKQAIYEYSEGREELLKAISLTKANKEDAKNLFQVAKDKGNPLAHLFYSGFAKNNDERIALLRYAKDKKIRMSLGLLGEALYRHGKGRKSDQSEALELFLQASEFGNKDAAFYAGRMYHFGHGTEKDYGLARKYYEIAVDRGSARAANNLSNLYAKGLGGPKNLAKKIKLLEDASGKGMPMGSYNLGMYYLNDAKGTPDWKAAEPYFEMAFDQAKGQYPDAAYQLGRIAQFNHTGKGKDYAKAAEYYSIAAKSNDQAAFHLGRFYREGLGVDQDIDKAIHYFKISAREKNSRSIFALGRLYDTGQLGVPDYKTAISYYEQAADLGHTQAKANLGWLYWKEFPETKQEAIHQLHREAIKKENMTAISNYGYLNLYQKLDNIDPKLGLELTQKAAEAGERAAIENLVHYYKGTQKLHAPDPKQAAYWRAQLTKLDGK